MTTQMNWINSLNDTSRRSSDFKENLSISKSAKEIELEAL